MQIIGASAGFIGTFLLRFFQLRLNSVSESEIAKYLNAHYPELKASTDLLLLDDQHISQLVQLQQFQTERNLTAAAPKIRFPNYVTSAFIGALVAAGLCIVVQENQLSFSGNNPATADENPAEKAIPATKLPADIKQAKVFVQPPGYTGIAGYNPSDLNLNVQENSRVTWTLTFSEAIKKASFVSSSRDTLSFSKNQNDEWQLSTTLDRNGFYQLACQDDSNHSSDYYKIEIMKDQAPIIRLADLDQFTQVEYNSKQQVDAKPALLDDYGLTDAYIIATVSKGSGESVKFREEKIRFSNPAEIRGKQLSARQTLDLKKLGLEPGDELYFYVEAIDNKIPVANRSRTETYFITIPDTAQDVMTADGGLGVDLMPEYFRSQRQIIIDTEKLIREKKTIAKKEFGSRSNELGYDQKVLRLRYGQFLGEEAESGVGAVEAHAADDKDEHDESKKAADMVKEFGHQHDTENEHNLVEEKDPTKKDVDGGKKENLLEGFVHEHDNEESATFFYQSLKMKLKAALAQMWDAELYLRLYEPEKSLPYQYTALKLLKEISNDSRIYVHRTGFEPPPIKEEKRLTADLNEVSPARHTYESPDETYFPGISAALQVVEDIVSRSNKTLSPGAKNKLLASGSELAQAALENPALLQGLTALKTVTSGKFSDDDLITLRQTYWLALPERPSAAGKNRSTLHELEKALLQNLLRQP
ncbi:MAG: hypothetical protein E6Q96_08125 [Cyclobacteriaceae bacterium]|nr:MAG: hypothetical protein E6Q96_08125 [Cyclobacteriaceae bacterium]